MEGRTVLEVIGGAAGPTTDGKATVTQLTSSELSRMVRPNENGRLECADLAAVRDPLRLRRRAVDATAACVLPGAALRNGF
jgi:hypothetical protein